MARLMRPSESRTAREMERRTRTLPKPLCAAPSYLYDVRRIQQQGTSLPVRGGHFVRDSCEPSDDCETEESSVGEVVRRVVSRSKCEGCTMCQQARYPCGHLCKPIGRAPKYPRTMPSTCTAIKRACPSAASGSHDSSNSSPKIAESLSSLKSTARYDGGKWCMR